ncbi:unnamed protein product [Choristocarpus tenellus]
MIDHIIDKELLGLERIKGLPYKKRRNKLGYRTLFFSCVAGTASSGEVALTPTSSGTCPTIRSVVSSASCATTCSGVSDKPVLLIERNESRLQWR